MIYQWVAPEIKPEIIKLKMSVIFFFFSAQRNFFSNPFFFPITKHTTPPRLTRHSSFSTNHLQHTFILCNHAKLHKKAHYLRRFVTHIQCCSQSNSTYTATSNFPCSVFSDDFITICWSRAGTNSQSIRFVLVKYMCQDRAKHHLCWSLDNQCFDRPRSLEFKKITIAKTNVDVYKSKWIYTYTKSGSVAKRIFSTCSCIIPKVYFFDFDIQLSRKPYHKHKHNNTIKNNSQCIIFYL